MIKSFVIASGTALALVFFAPAQAEDTTDMPAPIQDQQSLQAAQQQSDNAARDLSEHCPDPAKAANQMMQELQQRIQNNSSVKKE